MRTMVFVHIIEEVAHANVRNTPLEWFSSAPGQGVVPRLLSERSAGCISGDRHLWYYKCSVLIAFILIFHLFLLSQ